MNNRKMLESPIGYQGYLMPAAVISHLAGAKAIAISAILRCSEAIFRRSAAPEWRRTANKPDYTLVIINKKRCFSAL